MRRIKELQIFCFFFVLALNLVFISVSDWNHSLIRALVEDEILVNNISSGWISCEGK